MKHALVRSTVALLALSTLRCSESTTAQSREATAARPAASAAASGGAVAAEGKGLSITLSDVDTKLGAERLMDMRQREYDERKQALDALLEDRLVEKEAQAQGLSIEQLKKREVDDKAAKADKAEVEQLYAQNQRRLQGLPKDQALLTVERAVMQRNREVRAGEFRRELIKKHGVVVRLEPPRYEVGRSAGRADARAQDRGGHDRRVRRLPVPVLPPGADRGRGDPEALLGQGALRPPRLPARQHPPPRHAGGPRLALRRRSRASSGSTTAGCWPRPAASRKKT
jgi:hypothetical protein